ncbi:hypothetical protein C7H19_12590 [Aphanothece hegewaldii CCALA 016]|uniref:DUF1816 domain-containing protein n=1 Tax=Aphanothece hegewaldii CCALA 016 TaxID=2107694 RepID=A0A2T1LX78_9CHRO|nr:DUF1816 domain-containing protein [Aphanothece hegewaldii]PSF36801.1 hypothetical protein C7H19_12590 [Aphanothece hegewaldii CCALA 016]
MKELLLKLLDIVGLAFWVEITTENPRCTYYFGPFLQKAEATAAQVGYVEDLQSEGAKNIKVSIKRCKPANLTIFDDREDSKKFSSVPTFSGQSF